MQFNNTGQAIYLQIVDYVCEKILLGEAAPEEKLPSVRELAMQLEVNPNTVMRAYDFLKQRHRIFYQRRCEGQCADLPQAGICRQRIAGIFQSAVYAGNGTQRPRACISGIQK
jgi:DNA-binding transcriptional regulator YhcF (GntR family)